MAFKGILDLSDCRVDLGAKTECESDVNFIFILPQVSRPKIAIHNFV